MNKTARGWYLCGNERGGRRRQTKLSSMKGEDTLELIAPALSASVEPDESHEANHSLSHHHLP